MKQMKIGRFLNNIRTSRNIKLRELTYGLCSESALSKYESGERIPDSLLTYVLLQRLGEFPTRISIMISKEDAEYYSWKETTLLAIQKKEWDVLQNLLDVAHVKKIVINERLQLQYELYLQAVLYEKKEMDLENAWKCVKEALEISVPDLSLGKGICVLLSSEEINLYLLLLSYEIRLGKKTKGLLQEQLFYLLEYVEEHVQDKFERAKILPRVTAIILNLVGDNLKIEERISFARKAFDVLIEVKGIYDLPEILYHLENDLREIQPEQSRQYEKQRKVLLEIIGTYYYPYEFRGECWYSNHEHICLINEYLIAARKEMDLSQEQASEGICEPENYSRIEGGKRAPSVKNYYRLAEKMGIGWGYYRGQIDTAEIKDFHLLTEQRLAFIRGDINEAKALLKRLEKRLDMNSEENQQYIQLMEVVLQNDAGELQGEEFLKKLYSILELSISNIDKIKRTFTKTEIEIIFQIALYMYREKQYDNAKYYLEKVLENNRIGENSTWYETGAVRRLLLGILVTKRVASKSELSEIISLMLEAQDAQLLPEVLNLNGWDYELCDTSDRDKCLDFYLKAFYMSDLYQMIEFRELFKGYCEKEGGTTIKFY